MKTSKCKFCLKEFIKTNPLVPYCSPKCSRSAESARKKLKEAKTKERKAIKKTKKQNSMPYLRKKCDDLWSEYVKFRDKKCMVCGRKEYLNAHHIYSRCNQATRYEAENGITLCAKHHTMSSEFSAHKTPLEFIEWLEKTR